MDRSQGKRPATAVSVVRCELARRPGGNALILVVERDPFVRKLERFFLEKAGFAVEFSDDGEQALARARTLKPNILISEILVPGMDGLSVCRTLKSDPATRDIVVVILSVLMAEQRALDAGADAFLRKPLDDALLIESVATLLQKQREAGANDHGTD